MYRLAVVVMLISGVAHADAKKKPKLVVTFEGASTNPSDAIDHAKLDKVIRTKQRQVQACYTKALAKNPSLEGIATVTFTVGANGKLNDIAMTDDGLPGIHHEALTKCVVAQFAKLRLPKPNEGAAVPVSYGLTFGPQKPDPAVQSGVFASLTGTGDISSGFDDTNIYGGLLGSDVASGSGTGGTLGGMRGRSAPVPNVAIGQPNATGDLDKAIIRRYIKRNIQKITYCYEKELLNKAGLQGTVTVDFTIDVDGKVASSKGGGLDKEVDACVASVIKAIEFPKPRGGGVVTVKYPFTFRPGDTTPAKPTP